MKISFRLKHFNRLSKMKQLIRSMKITSAYKRIFLFDSLQLLQNGGGDMLDDAKYQLKSQLSSSGPYK